MTGGEIAAALITAATSAYQLKQQDDLASRQRQASNNAQRIAEEQAAEARRRTVANAQTYQPEQRSRVQGELEQGLTRQFEQSQAEASPAPVNTMGATSGAYKGALAQDAGAEGARASTLNRIFARTLAPGRQAAREGIGERSAAEEAASLYRTGQLAMDAGARDASRMEAKGAPALVGGLGGLASRGLASNRLKLPTIFGSTPSPYMLPQE